MKHSLIALAVALATCTAVVAAPVKTATAKKPAATKKAPARKAPVQKTTAKKRAVKNATPAPKVVATPAPAPVLVPGAEGEFPVYTGDFRCDEGLASITVEGDQFNLRAPGGRNYAMRRVPTTSRVVRLENDTRSAYWLQSGNKSMLIDTRAGGRVADGCRNAAQQAREDELKLNPTSLLQ